MILNPLETEQVNCVLIQGQLSIFRSQGNVDAIWQNRQYKHEIVGEPAQKAELRVVHRAVVYKSCIPDCSSCLILLALCYYYTFNDGCSWAADQSYPHTPAQTFLTAPNVLLTEAKWIFSCGHVFSSWLWSSAARQRSRNGVPAKAKWNELKMGTQNAIS